MRLMVVTLAAMLLLAGCSGGSKAPAPTTTPSGREMVEIPNGTVRFVVIGDQGQGSEPQRRVAEAMRDVCYAQGCSFGITAGDNIYGSGVRDVYDPQFEDKFENIYHDVPIDFYLVLGNHDNGNGAGSNPTVGDHQVEYSTRPDRLSTKWHMPGRNYVLKFGDVSLIGIDSGPEEIAQTPTWPEGSRGDQLTKWAAAEMPKVTTKWKFAFAHHPYISNAQHGDAGIYDGVVGRGLPYKLFLEQYFCGKLQVFFAGHDHSLQWLKPVQSCGRTEFVVSGAGGASMYTKKVHPASPANFEMYRDAGKWGFVWVDVTGDTATIVFYDDSGKELHRGTVKA